MSEERLRPYIAALEAHGYKPDRISGDSDGGHSAYFLFEGERADLGYIVVHADAEGISVLDFHPTRGIDADDIVDAEHCIQVVAKYFASRSTSLN